MIVAPLPSHSNTLKKALKEKAPPHHPSFFIQSMCATASELYQVV